MNELLKKDLHSSSLKTFVPCISIMCINESISVSCDNLQNTATYVHVYTRFDVHKIHSVTCVLYCVSIQIYQGTLIFQLQVSLYHKALKKHFGP